MSADPISHVAQGYNRFRRYAPRMLRCLEIKATPVAESLMAELAPLMPLQLLQRPQPQALRGQQRPWPFHRDRQIQ